MNDEPRKPDDAPETDRLTELEARLAEIDQNIEAKKAQSREEINKIQDDFSSKMDDMDARLQAARKKDDQRKESIQQGNIATRETGRGLGIGLTVAYAIIGAPLAGAGAGWLIDRSMGLEGVWMGWLTLLGAVGGIVFTVMVLNKHQR